jgi:hypothetical protein
LHKAGKTDTTFTQGRVSQEVEYLPGKHEVLSSNPVLSIWAWWCTSVIPSPRRLRQKDCEFRAVLRPCLKISKKKEKNKTLRKQIWYPTKVFLTALWDQN